MPTLLEINNKIGDYLYLEDKDIVKLIAGFCLTCKLPIKPLWLFIAAGSSAGKTALIELFELIPGFTQVDNMTANSLQSGMKRTNKSPSFLDNLSKGAFIVFKDFTSMMSKNPETLADIMGQLRVVYDGSTVKLTGGLRDTQVWKGKVSMLGAGTGVLYSKNDQFAEMGQRMVIYSFDPAGDYDISGFKYDHKNDDSKIIKLEIQCMIRDYVASISVSDDFKNLPDIDRETWFELTDIAHIATKARSPVTRNKYRNNELMDKGFAESYTRMFDQICAAAYGLMLQNPDGQLTPEDKKLLFKLGLDCIDLKRRAILQALTKFSLGGGIEELHEEIKYPKTITENTVEELLVFGLVTKERVPYFNGKKTIYKITPFYRRIMEKFEHIVPIEKEMPKEEEPLPVEPEGMPWVEINQQLI